MAQVSSYNVANRTGAQVRADINDIYDAIKTCNSGTSDPSSPVKFMLFRSFIKIWWHYDRCSFS